MEKCDNETNTIYNEIQRRTDKIIALRAHAQDIANYANKECAFCSFISCPDCPMNIGEKEIVCLANVTIKR